MEIMEVSPAQHELTGKYTLILYYGDHPDGTGRVAFLDRDDDQYMFEPYAPDSFYEKVEDLDGADALRRAEEFVSDHPYAAGSIISAIVNDNGVRAGFEVKPLYEPVRYGTPDILDIHYTLDGFIIRIDVRLTNLF
ncbi:MAG: hypothetical protein RBT37_08800 [Dissulfurispiraceae bacterium]|jgi:hypothetical protein|nr:hypothetical protein [Dissulfurispiraceae bacterium]